jgi:RNA polymerase sigma-70 factor (ECF subfamily)
MDEIALINDARQGDLDAFNRLVLAYQDRVYSQAYRVLNDPQSADDATQEAFISAYKNLRSFRGGSFRAWLLRIVTNACYDELRRRKRKPTTSLEPMDDSGNETDVIGKPLGTVKSRLARARSRMRDCLQGFWELLPLSMRQGS